MIARMQSPAMFGPDINRLRGFALALALSVPLWAMVVGAAKLIL